MVGFRILKRRRQVAADVVENFRPGTMERLGLSYESLSKPYPRLVYCSISGFGQSGPRRREAGYDAVVQAEQAGFEAASRSALGGSCSCEAWNPTRGMGSPSAAADASGRRAERQGLARVVEPRYPRTGARSRHPHRP